MARLSEKASSASGARCIAVTERGRIFFTAHDGNYVGEVVRG